MAQSAGLRLEVLPADLGRQRCAGAVDVAGGSGSGCHCRFWRCQHRAGQSISQACEVVGPLKRKTSMQLLASRGTQQACLRGPACLCGGRSCVQFTKKPWKQRCSYVMLRNLAQSTRRMM